MSGDTTYNGWRNVETWRVQLHLANDEQTAAMVAEVAESYVVCHEPQQAAAEWFRWFVTTRALPDGESRPDNWAQFSADVVQAALSRVDWEQIAAHWLEAARHKLRQGSRA